MKQDWMLIWWNISCCMGLASQLSRIFFQKIWIQSASTKLHRKQQIFTPSTFNIIAPDNWWLEDDIFSPIQIRHFWVDFPFPSRKRVTSLSNYISMNAPLHGTEKRSFFSWFTEASPVAISAFNHCGFLGWIQFPPSVFRTEIEARFRTLWAANHWQAPRGLGEVVGHQDGRPWMEAVGRLLYLGPTSLFLRLRKENGNPYFRQNLSWGKISLIVGQIKSFHPPQQKEMNMMVSINLYGDVRGYIHLRYFWNCFCFGCKKTDLRLKQRKVSRGRCALTLSNILTR